jgi:anti-anti-sigma factor
MSVDRADPPDPVALRLTASPVADGTVRLALAGEIDLATAEVLRGAMTTLLGDHGVTRLVVDFAEVEFLDAAGITALLAAYRYAGARGIAFTVVNCPRTPLRVLEIVALDKLLTAAEPPSYPGPQPG